MSVFKFLSIIPVFESYLCRHQSLLMYVVIFLVLGMTGDFLFLPGICLHGPHFDSAFLHAIALF